MLPYKYYLNTVTRTVSKYTAKVLLCYHINIKFTQPHVPLTEHAGIFFSCYHKNTILTQSHVPSVNTQYTLVILSYKYYLNTFSRTVSKHTATVLSYYHINITQLHVPSVNTQLNSCHITV